VRIYIPERKLEETKFEKKGGESVWRAKEEDRDE